MSRQRGAAREGDAVRPARADGAAATRAAEAAQGRRRGRVASRRPANSAATSTISWCRSPTRWSWRSATCRARACRRRSTACLPASWCAAGRSGGATPPDRCRPAGVLASINTILHERQLEEYYCTLCYAVFDLQAPHGDDGELRPAVSRSAVAGGAVAQIELPGRAAGLVLRSRPTTRSRCRSVPATCSCSVSDGISETFNEDGAELGSARVAEVVRERAIGRRPKSSTRSSRRWPPSGATPNRTTTRRRSSCASCREQSASLGGSLLPAWARRRWTAMLEREADGRAALETLPIGMCRQGRAVAVRRPHRVVAFRHDVEVGAPRRIALQLPVEVQPLRSAAGCCSSGTVSQTASA